MLLSLNQKLSISQHNVMFFNSIFLILLVFMHKLYISLQALLFHGNAFYVWTLS
jgi:hypothetical protein